MMPNKDTDGCTLARSGYTRCNPPEGTARLVFGQLEEAQADAVLAQGKPQADGQPPRRKRAELLARTSYSTLNVSLLTLFSHGTWGKLRV